MHSGFRLAVLRIGLAGLMLAVSPAGAQTFLDRLGVGRPAAPEAEAAAPTALPLCTATQGPPCYCPPGQLLGADGCRPATAAELPPLAPDGTEVLPGVVATPGPDGPAAPPPAAVPPPATDVTETAPVQAPAASAPPTAAEAAPASPVAPAAVAAPAATTRPRVAVTPPLPRPSPRTPPTSITAAPEVAPAPAADQPPAPAATAALPALGSFRPDRRGMAGTAASGRPCMDSDLLAVLKRHYGDRPGLEACHVACLPLPIASLKTPEELDAIAAAGDFTWCEDSCIAVAGYTDPDLLIDLEEKTGRRFCASDGASLCWAPSLLTVPLSHALEKVGTLYEGTKPANQDGKAAVVIGNTAYRSPLSRHDQAQLDAEAVRTVLVDELGYRPEQVIVVTDATAQAMRDLFAPEGALARLKPTGPVTVYVASLGVSDPATGRAYLLPVDADPIDLEGTAIALQDFYTAIAGLGLPEVSLVLEASFPRRLTAIVEPPNLPEAEVGILPAAPADGLSVLTAGDRDQMTLTDPEFGLGLFTRYWLEGLAGAADLAPIGNGDRTIDEAELAVYTSHRVRIAARKSFGLDQRPSISESRTLTLRAL